MDTQKIFFDLAHLARVAEGFQALHLLYDTGFDAILLDYHLPHFNGLTLYTQIRAIEGQEETPIILLGGDIPQDEQNELLRQQITILNKPFELDDLFDALEQTAATRI